MYHTFAFRSTTITNAGNVDVPALQDDIVFIQNGHFIFQSPLRITKAAAMSLTLARARITSPTIRQIAPNYIRPVMLATLPFTDPNVDRLMVAPLLLPALEEIAVESTITAAGPETHHVILWASDHTDPIPPGPVYRLRWTSTTAAVAGVWTTILPTFEQQLIAREYTVIGSEHFSTNGIAHRLIMDNQYMRPGALSAQLGTARVDFDCYNYTLGAMGRFKTTNQPRIQVLCNAADATHEGYIHVVPGPGLVPGQPIF